jgi:hypothetical protein
LSGSGFVQTPACAAREEKGSMKLAPAQNFYKSLILLWAAKTQGKMKNQ